MKNELDALAKVARALDGLTPKEVERILDYAAARHDIERRVQSSPFTFVPYYIQPTFPYYRDGYVTTWDAATVGTGSSPQLFEINDSTAPPNDGQFKLSDDPIT